MRVITSLLDARKESVMDDAKELWSWWQLLLVAFRGGFTLGGWARFVQWVTGTVLCPEEHTITQILTALGLEAEWRNLERFAEYGAWDRQTVERQLMRLVQTEHPARWGKYHPVALDDTKEHRSSAKVWGTCTFHESTARSPNRATTVRAHNWVVLGDLAPGKPWTYLPVASRLYFRKSQLPAGETFRTKTALAVDMLRQADAESAAPILAAFDGAYAMSTVVKPCLLPPPEQRRIEIVTRLRKDARLYEPLQPAPKNPKGGRPRQWGQRLPAPQDHEHWPVPWQDGRAYIYGRLRSFRYKRLRCCWSVSGPRQIIYAYVFDVPGYDKLWATITSAEDLSPAQALSANGARFRQEDGFRDHKQRLGMEECRAWTKEPILRTFQVQMVAQTLLRLLQFRLDAACRDAWRPAPEWNPRKRHASILDLRRLFWQHRTSFAQVLAALAKWKKPPQTKYHCGEPTTRAA
jgi:DDE superfamily endonuclease